MDIQALFKKLLAALFTPRYHPERHYMRGPGPACRATSTATHLR